MPLYKKGNVHTVHNKIAGRWENKQDGVVKSSASLKEVAVDYGKVNAKIDKVEHLIHGLDGTIQERNSYGDDSYPPKG